MQPETKFQIGDEIFVAQNKELLDRYDFLKTSVFLIHAVIFLNQSWHYLCSVKEIVFNQSLSKFETGNTFDVATIAIAREGMFEKFSQVQE